MEARGRGLCSVSTVYFLLQYFSSKNKLQAEGYEDKYEIFNRQAYEIAKKVSLSCYLSNICNKN